MLMKVREANFKGRFVRVHWLATIFYGSRALFLVLVLVYVFLRRWS